MMSGRTDEREAASAAVGVVSLTIVSASSQPMPSIASTRSTCSRV
jgi:hypothetical protein